jgi:hypothetical protein
MFTVEQASVAVAVIKEIAGDPDAGIIKDLIDAIEKSVNPAKEVRVLTAKETR